MDATTELRALKGRLEAKIRNLQSELETVDRAILLLDREGSHPEAITVKTKNLSGLGVTDAIRSLIGAELVTPLQVRDGLTANGFHYAGGATKLLNVVWATMQRLADSTGFEAGKASDGKFAVRRKATEGQLPLAEANKPGVEKVQ